MKILGICGKKRSGKDTAGEYLIENYGYVRYAFGDPVKDVCRVMFKFTEEQLYGDKKEIIERELAFLYILLLKLTDCICNKVLLLLTDRYF